MATATRVNEDIKKDVVDQLYWDGRIDASDVTVKVSDGEVTLSGTVPNYMAYEAAAEDAWSMAGVRYVHNDLEIKYPPEAEIPNDAQIKANVESVLLWQPNVDSTEIEVSVENGWVILCGNVDAYWKKIKAGELALGLNGVLGITNELAVVPTQEIEDKMIAENIEAAMERSYGIDVDLIDVKVAGGIVSLTGSVPSLAALKKAQEIAQNTPGVLLVNNELIIR